MAKAAKAVFVISFLLLNVYLAWDSGLLRAISPSLFYAVNAPIQWQNMALWNYFNLSRFTGYAYVVTDLENLALLIVLMASVAWLSWHRGLRAALLRSAQVAAFCLLLFEVELALLDCPEFFLHVTDFQESFNFVPWFNNADLFLSSLAVLMVSSVLLKLSTRGSASAVASRRAQQVIAARRDLRRFLILFLFGLLFVIGGWAAAYYGGVWQLSYSNASSTPEDHFSHTPQYMLTGYSECRVQLGFLSVLPSHSSCSLAYLNSDALAFVGLGGISMLVGLLALRKRPTVVAERVSGLWWLLALVVPLLGGIVGYVWARGPNRTSGTNMMIVGIETFVAFALLSSNIHLIGFDISSACTMRVNSSYAFWIPSA